HRDPLLVPVCDLLRVVEAARQDEVHLDAPRIRDRLDLRAHATGTFTLGTGRADGGHARRRLVGFGLGPVVEVLPAAARRQASDVRPFAVALLEALLGGVAVLVLPIVVLLGDAEVDERA